MLSVLSVLSVLSRWVGVGGGSECSRTVLRDWY